MGLFITSGFPDPRSTLSILRAVDEAGTDFVELGMPFSDPLAEGLPVQRSSERALRQGTRMRDAFTTAEEFRSESDTPLLLMGYVNPVYRYGVRDFCRDAHGAGVDGLILADLPPEESAVVVEEASAAGLGMVHLIAPNTSEERVRRIDELTTAFVYAVSITGLTGSGLGSVHYVEEYLQRARRLVVGNPLLVGFGIRSHADAERLSAHTDGFIVGSALIQAIEKVWDDPAVGQADRIERISHFVRNLKYGPRVEAR